jgi:hypothetical protein
MRAWATVMGKPEGGPNVVDDRCGTDSSVGTRAGEQLHDGWVYPYFACARDCSGGDQRHSGAEICVNDLPILICRSYIYQHCNQMIAHLMTGGEK